MNPERESRTLLHTMNKVNFHCQLVHSASDFCHILGCLLVAIPLIDLLQGNFAFYRELAKHLVTFVTKVVTNATTAC